MSKTKKLAQFISGPDVLALIKLYLSYFDEVLGNSGNFGKPGLFTTPLLVGHINVG
jgi:hypothetical protein